MRFLWIIFVLIGIWFLVSAATENGLLPSGHAMGRVSEIVLGVALIAYGVFRLTRKSNARTATD